VSMLAIGTAKHVTVRSRGEYEAVGGTCMSQNKKTAVDDMN